MLPRIDMSKINNIIWDTPGIDQAEKEFYTGIIKARKEAILDYSADLLSREKGIVILAKEFKRMPDRSLASKDIARTFGCCRFVYNRALDVKKTAYSETGKSIATNDLIKMIPAWKRDPETSWLAQVDSMALQQSIRDLDRAYKNFFRRVREGGKPGFPKFKSRRHARQSYRTNGGKILDRNHIALPKLGNVRAKVSRPLQGRFMSVTVSLDAAGRYFATFLYTDVPSKDAPATDREVGIDLGVEALATLSDGTKIENPRHLKKYERKRGSSAGSPAGRAHAGARSRAAGT